MSVGSITDRIKNLSPKAKQYLVLGGLGSVFLGLVFGSVAIWDQQPTLPAQAGKEDLQPKNIATPGSQADPRDIWMSQSSQQMKEMDAVVRELRQKLAEVEGKQSAPLQQQPLPARQESILPPLPPMPPPSQPKPVLEAPLQQQPALTGRSDEGPLSAMQRPKQPGTPS